jgi:tetratricopeptide (TPR) repeat protein
MDAELRRAWQSQQSGRHAEAARLYHALLTQEPNHPDALHLFGVLHHQNGYHQRAVELIRRAVALRPGVAAYHANLAEAHRALGQHQHAIDCCRAALDLQPDYPEAANNLGLALHDLGHSAQAAEQFRNALQMRPGFAMAQNNLGTSLLELGQEEDALEAYRAAVALDANLALARSNLGQMLVDRGQAEEALPHCLEAVRLQSRLPAAHNNLGNVYRALERWDEARAAYHTALQLASPGELGPELTARVHANLGFTLQLEHKRAEALPHFQRAAELAPDDVQTLRVLADAHSANENTAAALPYRQRVVALRPGQAQAHNDLGWALQEVGRLTEAADCYRRAVELQPDLLDGLLNQGNLHEEQGELAQAEQCYRQALAVHPRAPAALARLATLLRGKLPEADRMTLRQMLDKPQLAPGLRSSLLFGLAQVHDACGEYTAAAECLAQANPLVLEQRRQQGKTYDPTEHSGMIDRIIAGFTTELFSRLSGAGDDTRQPVFVFGMPRSGTTLVEQVLASHSQVHGAGELPLARQVFESVPALLGMPDDMASCLKALDAGAVQELSRRHREGLEAILQRHNPSPGPPERIVDKMPDNYLYVGMLALLFPRATFLHVCRDPRDVAVSCWMTNFRSIRWANDPQHLAGRIREYRRLMAHWQAVLPVLVCEVVYEQLVDDFEAQARRLVAACGLEWEPACVQFHQTARPVRTASVTQVRQPLYRRSLARWKHYQADLAHLFALLPAP